MGRHESFDEWDNDGSAAGSVGGSQADKEAVKKQFGKLDETEVISLLRTLYLKSGQPKPKSDGRDDDNDNDRGRSRSKSQTRRRGRSRSGGSQKGKPRHKSKSRSPARAKRGSNRSVFGRGNQDRESVCESRGNYSWRSKGRNKTGAARSKKRGRRRFFGRNKAKVGDHDSTDHGTKPSKIQMNQDDDFEYLNDASPFPPQHPPPLGLMPTTRQPRPTGMGHPHPALLPSDPRLPSSAAPRLTLEDLRNRPSFVRGEAILQAEPVQALTPTTGIGLNTANQSAGPPTNPMMGPHNTVQGQPVGPPRTNTLRGTHMSPIVEASDVDIDVLSSKTPNASNRTPLQLNLSQQISPSPTGDDPRAPPLKTLSNFSTPGIPHTHTGHTSKGVNSAGFPKQIMVDPYGNQREYVANNFGAKQLAPGELHSFVSDLSEGRRDPWNHSPNSVMSQMMKDLEPNSQCWIRGSTWYDALHYMCARTMCDGRGTRRDHEQTRNQEFIQIDPKKLKKKTRKALEKFLVEANT